jgi:hypothetical protein
LKRRASPLPGSFEKSETMSETIHLRLPYLAAAQAQKHVTHNEALSRLDATVQLAVIDAGHNCTFGTGALSGTTGTAGKHNIAMHTDGKLYIENRTSIQQTYSVTFQNPT